MNYIFLTFYESILARYFAEWGSATVFVSLLLSKSSMLSVVERGKTSPNLVSVGPPPPRSEVTKKQFAFFPDYPFLLLVLLVEELSERSRRADAFFNSV